jgi:hypothetical protein
MIGSKKRRSLHYAPNEQNERVPHTPEFPGKLVGSRELHAPFLNERRTRGSVQGSVQEIRVSGPILARCGKEPMLARGCRLRVWTSRARSVNSHIWPKPGQIWGTLVRGTETSPRAQICGAGARRNIKLARPDVRACLCAAARTEGVRLGRRFPAFSRCSIDDFLLSGSGSTNPLRSLCSIDRRR